MSFRELKVGDGVIRRMGADGPPSKMKVMAVTDKLLICAAPGTEEWPLDQLWTFDRETGIEEDEQLGWGRKFGVTGTYLQLEQ